MFWSRVHSRFQHLPMAGRSSSGLHAADWYHSDDSYSVRPLRRFCQQPPKSHSISVPTQVPLEESITNPPSTLHGAAEIRGLTGPAADLTGFQGVIDVYALGEAIAAGVRAASIVLHTTVPASTNYTANRSPHLPKCSTYSPAHYSTSAKLTKAPP